MKGNIPKIIHQIWSGIDGPLPIFFRRLGETWKSRHLDWEYVYWDNVKMNDFIQKYYPKHWEVYNKYPYNVQRWDAIRYLILDRIGGMYVDFDYECIESMNVLLENKTCCFALEPQSHCDIFSKNLMFNNALMASEPGHPFMRKIVNAVFSEKRLSYDPIPKNQCVLNTTGPWILIELYDTLTAEEKKTVYLIPDKYVTPFSVKQAKDVRRGEISEELEHCLKEAYAVHYFTNSWLKDSC
jgi:mannosyltransferase OCH1-like enzyme